MCATPGGKPGLQTLINSTPAGGTLCLSSGTYAPPHPLKITASITIEGVGDTTPVIDCTERTFCFDGSSGPSDVTLQNFVLQNATKSDVQIGASVSPTASGWTLDGITAIGAGEAGIAINNAEDVTVTDVTVTANGTTPYDPVANPTGDFGLRANEVDGITVEASTFTDNPVVPETTDQQKAFSGGAKFDTVTHALVQNDAFSGNSGGAQLWFDIGSMDFHAVENTVVANANSITGDPVNEGIRAEVSCAGDTGSSIESNQVEVGFLSGIDLYDSQGIEVTGNDISVLDTAHTNYTIRMVGNHHGDQPNDSCSQDGLYPNRENVASNNDIDMSASGKVRTGILAGADGITENDTFVGNHYTARHCTNVQWFFDIPRGNPIDFTAWQGLGEDADGSSTCTAVTPDIDDMSPFSPTWGPPGTLVTINGTGLQNVSTVKFNGKNGAIQSVAPTQVQATVPSGVNATGPVCVSDGTNPQRCTTAVFTVAPIVTISGSAPASGRSGDGVVISGQALTGATGVTFGGVAASFTFVSDTEIDATVPLEAPTGPVRVQMPIQGIVCGPTFSIVPPDPPVMMPFPRFALAPFSAAWAAAAGADSYQLAWQSAPFNGDFGPWQDPIATTDTSYPVPFVPGTTTCAHVAAVNGGGATPSADPQCTAVPVDDTALAHGASWTSLPGSAYFQGSASSSKTKGASLTLTGAQADRVSLLLEVRPGGGTVNVLINGKVVKQIPTAGKAVVDRHLVVVGSWTKLRTMTVVIRIVSTNKPVVIDGLALSRV
jgi:hypothetical protein